MNSRKRSGGFTLIEVMLVVLIIGILAAVVVPRLVHRADEAKISRAKADLRILSTQLDTYYMDTGEYPTTEQGLAALLEKPNPEPKNWKGPYLKGKSIGTDPWGNEYIYRYPGKTEGQYDLLSAGPDGQEGTEDDIEAFGDAEKSEE